MRRRSWILFVILALIAPAAAGCVTLPGTADAEDAVDTAGDPAMPEVVFESLAVEVEDGVRLDVGVFRPATDEPVPVLLIASPYYWNLKAGTDVLDGFNERFAEYFIPHGYAIAQASVRGTGLSEGCFDLGGEQEREDLHRLVEHLAALEWSNGNVGMIGKSYDGTTPWEAAITAPPSLKTIVPISGITDMYRYMFYEGAAYRHGPIFNTYYPLIVEYGVGIGEAYPEQAQGNDVRPCPGFPAQVAKGVETGLGGDHDAFWDERNYEPHLDRIEASVFLVHGLQDWNVKPDHGVPVFDALDVPKRAWLGQWAHDYPDENRFNEEWQREDWMDVLLPWFEHFLKDVENGVLEETAVVEVQDQRGEWRNESTWPPERVEARTLHLRADGALDPEAPTEDGMLATFVADPVRAPSDEGAAPSGARFVTAPLDAPVHVAGAPEVTVRVSVDRPAANLAVALFDVDESGEWTELNRGFLDLRHRNGRDAGEPVSPGEVMEVTVPLYPQDLHFAEGHRLGIVVSGEKPNWIVPAKGAPATYTLHEGALTLPVLPEFAGAWSGGDADASGSALRTPVPRATGTPS